MPSGARGAVVYTPLMPHPADPQGPSTGIFARFVHSEAAGSALLLACTAVALVLANSPAAEAYFAILGTKAGVTWGGAGFAMTVQHWINDLLMVVFFFVVGLEIKREILVGQLSSAKKALLPVAAAAGGMIAPALIYVAFNAGGPGAAGWGIPMATDIAFALGVLAVFRKRVPVGLKVFLTALAIADDLGAVLVIALFYSAGIRWEALAAAAVCLALIAAAGRAGVRNPVLYVLIAFGVWAGVFASGVHATVAGVLVALLVPVRGRRDPAGFLALAEARVGELRGAGLSSQSLIEDRSHLDAISDLHEAAGDMRPPGLVLEETLHPYVVFLILPLFALFNAGVALEAGFVDSLAHPVSLGIIVGLVVGKPVGITLLSWAAVKSGRAALPAGVGWPHVVAASCVAGIGFTMSLFIAELAFVDPALLARAKVGVLTASVVAAALGSVLLALRLPRGAR